MFMVEYVYIPLTGKSYVTADICDSFEVVELNDREMRLEFSNSAFDMNRNRIKFKSTVIIPKQRIGVTKYEG